MRRTAVCTGRGRIGSTFGGGGVGGGGTTGGTGTGGGGSGGGGTGGDGAGGGGAGGTGATGKGCGAGTTISSTRTGTTTGAGASRGVHVAAHASTPACNDSTNNTQPARARGSSPDATLGPRCKGEFRSGRTDGAARARARRHGSATGTSRRSLRPASARGRQQRAGGARERAAGHARSGEGRLTCRGGTTRGRLATATNALARGGGASVGAWPVQNGQCGPCGLAWRPSSAGALSPSGTTTRPAAVHTSSQRSAPGVPAARTACARLGASAARNTASSAIHAVRRDIRWSNRCQLMSRRLWSTSRAPSPGQRSIGPVDAAHRPATSPSRRLSLPAT